MGGKDEGILILNFHFSINVAAATIQKLIKEMLPSGIKCSNDTRDLVLQCCVGIIACPLNLLCL